MSRLPAELHSVETSKGFSQGVQAAGFGNIFSNSFSEGPKG